VQVALRLFRNKTAVNDDTIGTPYNAKAKGKGRRSLVTKHNITEVTPLMIAYASLQVFPTLYCIPASTPLPSTDVRRTVLYEAVGCCRWIIQPDPLLPPHREDALKQHRPVGD
jgi:hypothetical protein